MPVTAQNNISQLRLVSLIIGFVFIVLGMAEPLVPLYSLSLGASAATVGLIVAGAHLLPVFLAVPVGTLADRWGPRRVATLGALLFLAAPVLVVLLPGLPSVLGAQILLGVGQLGLILGCQTFVGLLAPPDKVESYFGWYTTAISAGQLTGPLLAGALVDTTGFRWAFGVSALLALVPVLASPRLQDRPGSRAEREASPEPERPLSKLELLRNPELQVAVIGSGGVLIAMGVRRAFLPLYMDELAFSASFIGLVMSIRSFFSLLVRSIMPWLIRTLGGRGTTLVIMSLVTAVSIGTLGLIRSGPLFIATAILTGLGLGITQPLTMVIATDSVPRSQHGVAMGVRLGGNRLAQLVGPLVFGVVAEWGGYGSAFLISGLLLVVIAGLTHRMLPRGGPSRPSPAQEAPSLNR